MSRILDSAALRIVDLIKASSFDQAISLFDAHPHLHQDNSVVSSLALSALQSHACDSDEAIAFLDFLLSRHPTPCAPIASQALCVAVSRNNPLAIRTLLPFSDPNFFDSFGLTPLMTACARGYVDCARALLACSDLHIQSASPPLRQNAAFFAARNGQHECFSLFADQDKPTLDLMARDSDGNSILHAAAQGGNIETLQVILAAAPQLAQTSNPDSQTPLMIAILKNRPEACRLLLPFSNLLTADRSGHTAIDMAHRISLDLPTYNAKLTHDIIISHGLALYEKQSLLSDAIPAASRAPQRL